MATGKTTKTNSAPKKAAPAVVKSIADPAPPKAADTAAPAKAPDTATPAKAADATPAKAEGGEKPASYSRGEGQKPVTQAYKDNWNAIFGNDKKKKKR